MLENITTLDKNRDFLMIRKVPKEHIADIFNILKYNKRIKIISHFENNFRKNILHLASFKGNCNFSQKSISFHKMSDLQILRRICPQIIFLSPIFPTKSHPDIKHLGKIRAFKMAKEIKRQAPKSQIFLLGGMNEVRFVKIKAMDFDNLFAGYAFIRGS